VTADLQALLRVLGEALLLASAKIALDARAASGVLSPARTLDEDVQTQDEASQRLQSAAWLRPEEAAAILGVTPRWLARRWRRLPFCRALPGGARGYRVDAQALAQEMRRRR
jgi:hypothetical protein